jgi:hypothetical protein
MCVEIS